MRNDLTLVSARKINGTKIELEFTQAVITGEERPTNILGLLNASDERFSQVGNLSHAWLSAEPQDATALFGVDFSSLKELGDKMELNIVNPTINDQELNMQIIETTNGNEYEVANMDKSAKRTGKGGAFILTEEGFIIYRRATIVIGEAKHFVFKNTKRHLPAIDSAVLAATSTEEEALPFKTA